jgi:hypothetical protein
MRLASAPTNVQQADGGATKPFSLLSGCPTLVRRIFRVRLPAPTKLILEVLTKMPGFLGLALGDCDAVQAEVNQVTSVC